MEDVGAPPRVVRQELGVLYRGLAQLAPQLRRRGQQGPAAVTLNITHLLDTTVDTRNVIQGTVSLEATIWLNK